MSSAGFSVGADMRRKLVLSIFTLFACVLGWRAMDLQLTNREFLQDHGDARYLRTVATAAHRGMITDRNGEPLAISTPVNSVWGQPRVMAQYRDEWLQLADVIGTTRARRASNWRSTKRCAANRDRARSSRIASDA